MVDCMSEKFRDPKISINKVYTKSGDNGSTFLIGGKKVKKYSSRVCAFGEIDQLNVYIGLCCSNDDINKTKLKDTLVVIQNDLFNLGNMLASPDMTPGDSSPKIVESSVVFLEDTIDYYNSDLDSLKSFVLPGGSRLSVEFHLARVVCRKCERLVVKICEEKNIDLIVVRYLNRLSDLLFVLSRYSNKLLNEKEHLWNPNHSKE